MEKAGWCSFFSKSQRIFPSGCLNIVQLWIDNIRTLTDPREREGEGEANSYLAREVDCRG